LLTSLLSAKLAAASAVALGRAAAAAYSSALPALVQKLAHNTRGAPAPRARLVLPVTPGREGRDRSRRIGPVHRARLKAHGSAQQNAVAFRNVATMPGAAANVTAWCAGGGHPQRDPAWRIGPATPGEPSVLSSHAPAGHHTGKPATRPGPNRQPPQRRAGKRFLGSAVEPSLRRRRPARPVVPAAGNRSDCAAWCGW